MNIGFCAALTLISLPAQAAFVRSESQPSDARCLECQASDLEMRFHDRPSVTPGDIGASVHSGMPCTDCHGEHRILSHLHPDSSVFRSEIQNTRGKRHPGTSEDLTRGTVHIDIENRGSGPFHDTRVVCLRIMGGSSRCPWCGLSRTSDER